MEIEDTEQEILLEPEAFADVGDGVLTIQKNGADVGTFAANQKTDTTVNITVPVATSELTNDANFQNANNVANAISTHNQSSSAHQDIRQAITDEATARINADNALQGQIDAIASSPDVVDIVDTYADLQAYNTQHLTDNDVIRVLNDETHNGESTYYRFTKNPNTWTYIGTTKQYTDFIGTDGQDAGEAGLVPAPATTDTDKYLKSDGTWATVGSGEGFNILTEDDLNWYDQQTGDEYVALWLLPTGHYTTDENSPNVTVSSYEQDGDFLPGDPIAVDMSPLIIINNYDPGNVYPDIMIIYPDFIVHYVIDGSTGLIDSSQEYGATFIGTDGNSAGVSGLVPAPATTDAGKFLKADGTWDTAGGGGPTVVQTTGTSTTDVMSQNAVTSMVFADPSTRHQIQIGNSADSRGAESIAIGYKAKPALNAGSIAIGANTTVSAQYSTAIGYQAQATRKGEFNVGSGGYASYGYNNTPYRVIGGVHDGQLAQDAVTVNQVNSLIDNLNSALNTNIPHIGS